MGLAGLVGAAMLVALPSHAGTTVPGPVPYRLADANPGTSASDPGNVVRLGNKAFFAATSATAGRELWVTNGRPDGTHVLLDIRPGIESGDPTGLVALGGRLLFAATDAEGDRELWVSTGTAGSTHRLADIRPGSSSNPEGMFSALGRVWFTADDGFIGEELWSSDGTLAGTAVVEDVNPGPDGAFPDPWAPAVLGTRFYFSAVTSAAGAELWSSDGTAAGTDMVVDLNGGAAGSNPGYLTRLGSWLLFSGSTATDGVQLWRTDGSAIGTTPVYQFNGGGEAFGPHWLTPFKGRIYFSADDGAHGREVYVTDGTPAGTGVFVDQTPGTDGSNSQGFAVAGGWLYFKAWDSAAGIYGALYATNGNAGSTHLVKNTYPGMNSDVLQLTPVRRWICFRATSAAAGTEPWCGIDALEVKTQLIGDLAAGAGAHSAPITLGVVGSTWILSAETTDAGREPYAYNVQPSVTAVETADSYSLRQAIARRIRVTVIVHAGGLKVDGKVVLTQGDRIIGRAAVVDGRATVRIDRFLGVGKHIVRAQYLGGWDARSSLSSRTRLMIVE